MEYYPGGTCGGRDRIGVTITIPSSDRLTKNKIIQDANMVEEKRNELFEVYQEWKNELKQSCPKLITEEFSHPYYLHIPDNWYES